MSVNEKCPCNRWGCTHTHTHTDSFLANGFCFLACNFLVAGVDFCAQNLIEFIGELAF